MDARWRPYPVVNLGQAPQYVATADFDSFFNTAKAAVNTIAAVARAHSLSDDEEAKVRSAVGSVTDATVPMAEVPGCPVVQEAPWWPIVAVSLLAGGLAAHFIL